jgi:threonine dehydrogenase-like Zn-dependent dehydrogenase
MQHQTQLPVTHKALVLHKTGEPLIIEEIPTPVAGPGSVVVRVLAASIVSYIRDVYGGSRGYSYPTPLVTGSSAVGRIVASGPDASSLKPGDLVFVNSFILARDDPANCFLWGIHSGPSEGSQKLMAGEWRDASWAEYAKAPLENCAKLDEEKLLGQMKYSLEQLTYIGTALVPYGGLKDVDLRPGETVVICPATGQFGGAAVHVALAMGAGKVIAMGRNAGKLGEVKKLSDRVEVVPLTGDVTHDAAEIQKLGEVDVFYDISPPEAGNAPHLKSALMALRTGGRVSLMGGVQQDVPFPHALIMFKNITLKGKFMYNREDITAVIKMVQSGLLKLDASNGIKVAGTYGLEDWDEAFTAAANNRAMGTMTVFKP